MRKWRKITCFKMLTNGFPEQEQYVQILTFPFLQYKRKLQSTKVENAKVDELNVVEFIQALFREF